MVKRERWGCAKGWSPWYMWDKSTGPGGSAPYCGQTKDLKPGAVMLEIMKEERRIRLMQL